MILVTGGMGLVGSNIARKLVHDGYEVVVLDQNSEQGADFFSGFENVFLESGDITNHFTLSSIFKKYEIKTVIHAAAITNGAYCMENPVKAVQVNTLGTMNLLEFCRMQAINKFIYVSSGSVFGLQESLDPIYESAIPTPMNTYATTKKLSEELVHCYEVNYGLDTTSVRISWVFGPTPILRKPRWNQGPIGYYFWNVLTENKLIEESGLDFQANFTHVDDVAEGVERIMLTPNAPQYVHLSSEELYSNHEIVDFLKEKAPESEIQVGAGVEPFVQQAPIRGPLVSEYKQDIGYKPKVIFKEALEKQFNWMKKELEKRGRSI